jgi:anaphase-promoting complex subunit 2
MNKHVSMKLVQPVQARPLYRERPESSESLRFLYSYLQSSDATQRRDDELLVAVSRVDVRALVNFYTGLIRSTFALKIAPAIAAASLTTTTLPGLVSSLADGKKRYEACWARLGLQEYRDVVAATFRALVRSSLDNKRLAPVLKQYLENLSGKHTKLIAFYQLCKQIGLGRLFQRLLKRQLFNEIDKSICDTCSASWDRRYLSDLSSALISDACALLSSIDTPVSSDDLMILESDSLARLRIAELFDIIVDYPASLPALEDLRHCLKRQHTLRSLLVTSFIDQCSKRLLHPGVNSSDIIAIYVSTIRTFTLLDPPGVLLDKVARPIRRYLRERGDTIRCIMTSLLNEADNLSAELNATRDHEAFDDERDLNWEPTPVDASPDYTRGTSDLLDSLISIYEHREVFVKELQVLLADRLLATPGYSIEGELRNLELLKRRFGGASLMASADVMVKDIIDSAKIDAQIQADSPGLVHTTVLSRLYWPKQSLPNLTAILADAQPQTIQLPVPVRDTMERYADTFAAIKPNRQLCFLPNLGHVRVELQLEDRDFDLLVTPAHASIIYQFSEQGKRTITQLIEALGMSEAELRRGLIFWTKQGILKETRTAEFTVIENVSQAVTDVVVEDVALEVTEVVVDDDMDMYWQFIVGMLTNVGALPLDRIQSMLGMFAPSYDRPKEELGNFLSKKMREGAVQLKAGMYKLS